MAFISTDEDKLGKQHGCIQEVFRFKNGKSLWIAEPDADVFAIACIAFCAVSVLSLSISVLLIVLGGE